MTVRRKARYDYRRVLNAKGVKPVPPHKVLRTERESGDVELAPRKGLIVYG